MTATVVAVDFRIAALAEPVLTPYGETRWLYTCDGMPTLDGCANFIALTRRLKRIGRCPENWVVCHGLGPGDRDDPSVLLVYCPTCALFALASELLSELEEA